jgi:hypothetical protein
MYQIHPDIREKCQVDACRMYLSAIGISVQDQGAESA